MSDFLSYWNRLRQFVPELAPEQAMEYVNQAWRDIRQANQEWTWLYGQEYWLAPASIGLQGVSTIIFSDQMELTHENIEQLSNQNNPALTTRQLRFGPNGGPIYNIASYDGISGTDGAITATDQTLTSAAGDFDSSMAGLKIRVAGAGIGGADLDTTIATYTSPTSVELTLAASTTVSGANFYIGKFITLDRPFLEQTNTNNQAQCYRILYEPIAQDWDRPDHLVDPIMGYEFGWDVRNADELDIIDPRRSSQGQPYRLYYHGYNDTTGLPIYELWPGPTAQRGYTMYRWVTGTDFVEDTDTLPPRLAEELLLIRARLIAYEWALTNDPSRDKRAAYERAHQLMTNRYSTQGIPAKALGLLDQALLRDKSIALTMYKRKPRNPGPGWPINDSNFAQSHAIPGWSY